MNSGTFITFEGIEGSGKSTHACLLVDRLIAAGHEVVATREPGGTRLGEAIRALVKGGGADECIPPETEMLLFAASRAELVRTVIEPALCDGKIVVSDRFVDSTTAYQGYARRLDMDTVLAVNRFVSGSAIPDLTILLDLDVETGLARARTRSAGPGEGLDRIEAEDAAFHAAVRAAYLDLANNEPLRFKVIDGARDVASVAVDVWRIASAIID